MTSINSRGFIPRRNKAIWISCVAHSDIKTSSTETVVVFRFCVTSQDLFHASLAELLYKVYTSTGPVLLPAAARKDKAKPYSSFWFFKNAQRYRSPMTEIQKNKLNRSRCVMNQG